MRRMPLVTEALPTLAGPTVPFRLTTESGVPVSTSDRSAQGTLYFTPNGSGYPYLPLYDGAVMSRWLQSTQLSLTLASLTSGKIYDCIVYRNGTTNYLDLMPAWTNDSTRANGIAIHASTGFWSNSGSITSVINGHTVAAGRGLYVGTIRTTGTATTEDSQTKRFVWNYYNRALRLLKKSDGTSHSYNSTTVRQWNAGSGNQVEFVLGIAGDTVVSSVFGEQNASGTTVYAVICQNIDATSSYDSLAFVQGNTGSNGATCVSTYLPAAGYHYISANEYTANGSGTFVQFGIRSGVFG